MPRPCMQPGRKRKSLSISVRPDVFERAGVEGNKSQFFENAVDMVRKARRIMSDTLIQGSTKELLYEMDRFLERTEPYKDR